MINLHLLCEIGAIHTSFYFSLEEYEEALKVNVLFDFFQYIHPSLIKTGVAENKKMALPGPGNQSSCFLALGSSLNVLLHLFFFLFSLVFAFIS